MSYNPSTARNQNPFFSAYRSSNQTPSIPGDFQASHFLNCDEDPNNLGKVKLTQKAYVIGEIKATTTGTSYNLYDIKVSGTDELAEGYQVRCNAVATVLMDDSSYGIAPSNASLCISAVAIGPNSTANALANQIRIMGIKTR